jgi:SAM-dependent methyltransferase
MDFHQAVIVPGLLRLLDLRPGEKVLDIACGQGAVSLALTGQGADVTGVDLSPELIRLARQRAGTRGRFVVGDARDLSFLEAHSFDAAVCVLAAQNIDPVEPVFSGCARALKDNSRAVFIIPHPAFRIPRQSNWHWDEARKLVFRGVDRYLGSLKVPIDMNPFRKPGAALTWTYHRPISVYVNGLANAGLHTNALEEWASHRESRPGPRASAENRARLEFPLFLALRCVKNPVS